MTINHSSSPTQCYQIKQINAFKDNYIWAIVRENRCAIVDPGDSQPVLAFLQQHSLILTDILITHHHPDHIGGVKDLLQEFPNAGVFTPNTERFDHISTFSCEDNQTVSLNLGIEFQSIYLQGHTLDHIGYYDQYNAFVGDTLFSVGCGRLFEGTPQQMLSSLKKLMSLPENTNIYCAHEYTLSNIDFALTVEPNNKLLQRYQSEVQELRVRNIASIPTTIKTQIEVNPFLRVSSNEIQTNVIKHFKLQEQNLTEADYFTYIRKWKDDF